MNTLHFHDLSYIAGLFDGEGCVGIYRQADYKKRQTKRGFSYRSQISLSNTNKDILPYIKSILGGHIYSHGWQNNRWKEVHEWRATTTEAANILKVLLPYLRIKRRQAELLIHYQAFKDSMVWPGRRGYTEQQWQTLKGYHDKMHQPNK